MKCDGLLPEVWTSEGPGDVTPKDVADLKAYVDANRTLDTPYDIVVSGKVTVLKPAEQQEQLQAWEDAGVTWWIEFFWGDPEERVPEVIKQGPPKIS
jgi:hypothetical protein